MAKEEKKQGAAARREKWRRASRSRAGTADELGRGGGGSTGGDWGGAHGEERSTGLVRRETLRGLARVFGRGLYIHRREMTVLPRAAPSE